MTEDVDDGWSVAVELVADVAVSPEELIDAVDDLVDVLVEHAPAVSVGSSTLEIRADVLADSPIAAADVAFKRVDEAIAKVGLDSFRVRRIEVTSPRRLEAALEEPVVPRLVGTAEVAALLGVSRQRVSELSRATHFPPPVTTLASGPVWAEPTILRFVESWKRTPGRPNNREEVVAMAGRKTSARAAKAASSVLRDARTSAKSKTAAASALSQRAGKSGGKKK